MILARSAKSVGLMAMVGSASLAAGSVIGRLPLSIRG
jgi:hypothetical protein